MKKESLLKIFQETVAEAGMQGKISVSKTVNELADIMIYQQKENNLYDNSEYLALDGKPLFPINEIRNVLYKYGKNKQYNYDDTEIQFVIELEGNSHYVLEYGDGGFSVAMKFNDEWLTDEEIIKKSLALYVLSRKKRNIVESMIYSVESMIENSIDIDELDLNIIKQEIYAYLNDNPCDKDFLIMFAYTALTMIVLENVDLFDFYAIIRIIVKENIAVEFVDYIKCQNYDSDVSEIYMRLLSVAIRKIREIENE